MIIFVCLFFWIFAPPKSDSQTATLKKIEETVKVAGLRTICSRWTISENDFLKKKLKHQIHNDFIFQTEKLQESE